MKPVDQVNTRRSYGDCFRACVASIFEFDDIEDMPNFWEQTQDPREFWGLVNEWLSHFYGYKGLTISVMEGHEYLMKDVLCIACGKTTRSDEDHAVVWKNGMIHDPNPSREGIVGTPNTFTFFTPLDPMQ